MVRYTRLGTRLGNSDTKCTVMLLAMCLKATSSPDWLADVQLAGSVAEGVRCCTVAGTDRRLHAMF